MDSDMGFQPDMVFQMIALGEEVVGAVCPRRAIDLEALHARGTEPFVQAYAQALDFVGKPGKPHPRNPAFCAVEAIGTGILLVSRQATEKMLALCPDVVDTQRFKRTPFAAKFSRFATPFDKIRLPDRDLSEDLSFAHRWTQQCGGRIYAAVDFEVQHVAKLTLRGRWRDR